jgi:two-component system, chemotaxis family, sensor kinase CheA
MSSDPTRDLFFEEAADLLRDFEAGLLRLEQAPADPEVLNRVFRSAHTLKGNSAMLGLEDIARFTHVLENLLARLRRGEQFATRRIIDTMLASADVLRDLLRRAQAEDGGDVPWYEETLVALQSFAEDGREAAPRVVRTARPPEATGSVFTYEIRFSPPPDMLRRGLDPVRLLGALEELGQLVRVESDPSVLPPLSEMDPETSYLGFRCWLSSQQPSARIRECFEFVADDSATTIVVSTDSAPTPGGGAAAGAGASAAEPSDGREATASAGGAESSRGAEMTTIRVPTDKVDRLIDLVGELVITQSMVARIVGDFTPDALGALRDAVGQMDRHARDLQERVMAVRMLPIRTVFSRFSRVVRDLAQTRGKEVRLETSGEDTELDKSVIELMSDPLTHLVRNAVDHGIEPPEVRRQAGKPEVGCLTLRAYQLGGNIYVEVADDGAGLNRERILAKAIEGQLISPDESFGDERVFSLIFLPGFSTAERVDEVSGRGVGMDVVKRNLEALGGSITIQSEPGRGTTFRVKLPLTLAILDGQSVQVGGETYILPLVSIVESIQPRRGDLNAVFGAGETVTMRGRVLPVLRLHRLFGVAPRSEDPTRGLIVIVEHDSGRVALFVDDLLGQQQVVIKSLEKNFQKLPGVAGATILGDGRVALILDVPGLVNLGRATLRLPRPAPNGPKGAVDALAGAAR